MKVRPAKMIVRSSMTEPERRSKRIIEEEDKEDEFLPSEASLPIADPY